MVKAGAYGHRVDVAVPALGQADAFGVACLSEALQIQSLIQAHQSIVLMEGAFSQAEWIDLCRLPFEVVIHSQDQLDWAINSALGNTLSDKTSASQPKLWLKVNTGMNRLGFIPETAFTAYDQLIKAGFDVALMSHFACADEPNHPQNLEQMLSFKALIEQIGRQVVCSLGNSAALLSNTLTHTDWVRPGLMLYGASPFDHQTASDLNLQAAMTFEAAVISIQRVQAGDSVGYGAGFVAERTSSIAVVSAGYGDGYPRVVTGAQVVAAGQLCPVVGRVSMDMLCINITGLESQVSIGTPVELWGMSMPIDQVAAAAGTIAYELLCRLSNRPMRVTEA